MGFTKDLIGFISAGLIGFGCNSSLSSLQDLRLTPLELKYDTHSEIVFLNLDSMGKPNYILKFYNNLNNPLQEKVNVYPQLFNKFNIDEPYFSLIDLDGKLDENGNRNYEIGLINNGGGKFDTVDAGNIIIRLIR